MYKIRTIDVWDTLLRRDCHPECIKLATAFHVLLTQKECLKPAYQNHWALYHARVDTERLLAKASRAKGRDDEYEITEILQHWLNTVFNDPVDALLSVALAEYELKVEMARSFRDSGIDNFLLDYSAARTLFLSDFYMNANMLSRLLEDKGFAALVREGISSCDTGLNKRSGRLFKHLHTFYGISPEEHVHVGDNYWSDVEAAERVGVKAIHYLPTAAHAERIEHERLFSSRESLFEHMRILCANEATQAIEKLTDQQSAAFRFGVDAAPLFIGFALWIAEQAVLENLDRLCFFTREGEFFYQVFSAIFPHHTFFGCALPTSGVLGVSRLSTFTPSLRDISMKEMSRIWTLFKSQSISGLFATLGVDIKAFNEELGQLGLLASSVIDNPLESQALKKLFCSPAFVNTVEHSISSQRSLLRDYMEQNGIHPGNRIGVIDIGWRGTIQDNLALILPQTFFYGMYLGLRRVINPQPANVFKAAYGPDENKNLALNDLFEAFSPLEMISTSPNGSVDGYSRINNQIVCRRQIAEEENATYEKYTSHFQQGVLLAAQHWRPYLERYVVSSSELRSSALRVWGTMCQAPDKDLAKLFIQTPQQDVFGFGDIFSRNRVPSLMTIFLAAFVKPRRCELVEFVRRVQWTAAIVQIQGIGRFHKWALILTFLIANQLKRLRMEAQRIHRRFRCAL